MASYFISFFPELISTDMTYLSTVITDNVTGNKFEISDGVQSNMLDFPDCGSPSKHGGCFLNDAFEETSQLQQLIIPTNLEGNITSTRMFLNYNRVATSSSSSTTCSTPYSSASPYLMSPFETSPPTPTLGLSLPSSPSHKNRQKPLDTFSEEKEYENDFESENNLAAPKGKSLDLQIFEYFNKSRDSNNKNARGSDNAEGELKCQFFVGSTTTVKECKISSPNIVDYKKGNYGYKIPVGANGYIFERVTGTGNYLIVKADMSRIRNKENFENTGMKIDETVTGSSKEGVKEVDVKKIGDKDERVIAKIKLKMKDAASVERKEALKTALVEARSKVGLSAEFTISIIPEHVLKMTSKYIFVVS